MKPEHHPTTENPSIAMQTDSITSNKAAPVYSTIEVTPLSPALAADVDAGDLRSISDEQFAEIKRAWLQHHVIRFRGQDFANADIVAFGRRFGEFQPNNPPAIATPRCPP